MVIGLALTSLSLFSTVCILNIFFRNPQKSVPAWVDNLIVCKLGKLMRIGRSNQVQSSPVKVFKKKKKKDANANGDILEKQAPTLTEYKDSINVIDLPMEIKNYVHGLAEKATVADLEDRNRADWKQVAKIIDRLCLICEVTLVGLITLMLIIVMIIGSLK